MQLNETPEIVTWPEMRYVFIEKTGPFLNTAPQAWQQLHQLVPEVSAHNQRNLQSFRPDRRLRRPAPGLDAHLRHRL